MTARTKPRSRFDTESRATEIQPNAAARVAPEFGRHLVERALVAEQDEIGVTERHEIKDESTARKVELAPLTVDTEHALRAPVRAEIRRPHIDVRCESACGEAPVQCSSGRAWLIAECDAEHIHRQLCLLLAGEIREHAYCDPLIGRNCEVRPSRINAAAVLQDTLPADV